MSNHRSYGHCPASRPEEGPEEYSSGPQARGESDEQPAGASAGLHMFLVRGRAQTRRKLSRHCLGGQGSWPPGHPRVGTHAVLSPLFQFSRSADAPVHLQGPNQLYNVSPPLPCSPRGEGAPSAGRRGHGRGLGLRSGQAISPVTSPPGFGVRPRKTETVIASVSWGRCERP